MAIKQITWTEFKKLSLEDVLKIIPIEVTYNGESALRVVPNTWKDPRFLVELGRTIGASMVAK